VVENRECSAHVGSPRPPCKRRLERILELNVPEGGLKVSRTSECTRNRLFGVAVK
jgi:hypothetical protein